MLGDPSAAKSPAEAGGRFKLTHYRLSAAARRDNAPFLWFMKASGSATIDVTLQGTIDGVAALVAAGVLSAADQAVLLEA